MSDRRGGAAMVGLCKVGKRGTVVIPAELRRHFGIEEGSFVIAEATESGVLIRPALAVPTDEYRRRFLADVDRGYAACVKTQRPGRRNRPSAERSQARCW